MTMQDDRAQLRRRVIKACTACKQSKVRCDADGKVGKTCSRCRIRGLGKTHNKDENNRLDLRLECEVDARFKRTPVRERMKAMAAELKELRQTVREGETSPNRRQFESLVGIEIEADHDAFAYPSPESSQYPGMMAHQHPFGLGREDPQDASIQPTSFGPIVFSVEEIRDCFNVYSEHFHAHLPILDLTTSIGTLQECSPLLFKTIIAIVCRRFQRLQRSDHDLQLLEDVYQRLLSQSILSGPLSLHTIQAILIICAWPLPSPYQLAEPSWLYCGVAMNAAGYLNLGRVGHKPLYQGGQLSSTDVENMSRTWLALFLISTNIAIFIGAPLPFKHSSDLAGIEARIARKEVPRNLAAHAALTGVLAKHSGILSAEADVVTHNALVQMHSEEMDRVARQYHDVWSDNLEFFLQASKLHLYISLWIRGSSLPDGTEYSKETEHPVPLGEILISATISACRVIAIYDRLIGDTSTTDSQTALHSSTIAAILPKHYFRRLTHAAFFLLRFVCFNKISRESERENARRHINMAMAAMKRLARGPSPKDEMARAAAVLEKLLEHGDFLQEQRLQIDDRGGASIYWDTMHRSLQISGIPTARTDLMELVDPTRTVKAFAEEKNGAKGTHMPTPSASSVFAVNGDDTQPAGDGVVWDESLMEFFDLNMFDIADLSNPLVG